MTRVESTEAMRVCECVCVVVLVYAVVGPVGSW